MKVLWPEFTFIVITAAAATTPTTTIITTKTISKTEMIVLQYDLTLSEWEFLDNIFMKIDYP